ncbi:zinc metalloprotease [Niveomyces insectorum RCEF 264]|uniref:Zinc metalloprotease n=1 Tax=Niveomyces insectorum RCEF 264 TaxID=1081102 RepID=A0A167UN52_9HYPO|nr:zinc metalloprotease [Niveomyces insectorum RCEF 264]
MAPPSRFRKVQSFETSYAPTTITQYVSERSGLHVVVANRPGPKINGYFTLATEIFDDSGAPHTLEHLVFMGSRSYQYKGLLDKLASRAYSGTNAWTAVDHTAYTLETAGWEGFAQILPVYLEHVLVPTLTDEACLTEVHHINGKGHDAGVVYSEMQALQSNSGELMDLRARRLLYPENVGFRYETGGMVEALRVLTADRIRAFHKAMYQPRNLAIIIVGEVDQANLISILDAFEESIKDVIPPAEEPFKRPWIDSPQPPPLEKTVVDTVEFPEDDESTGEIMVGYFGPNCNDLVATSALNVLLAYLCGSSASILENVIVEREELASSVSYLWESRPNSVIWLQPTGVATEKLAFVEQRLISLLKEVADKPFDMSYLRECISRERRQVKYQAESSESYYSSNIITAFLFGDRDGSTLATLKDLHEYDVLDAWTDEQWRAFFRTWIAHAHHVSILGKPSKALAKKLKAAEKARVAERRKQIGPEGLKKLQARLDQAKEVNDRPIPEAVLDQWEVPGTDSIHFIESHTARAGRAKSLGVEKNNAAQTLVDAATPGQLPLFLQFEDVPSNFVRVTVHVSTANVPVHLKPLLWIFSDNFFNSPLLRDGQLVDFEDVVKELEKDTVSYGFRSGDSFGDAESVAIQLRFEPDKYATIVRWLRALMFEAVFDPARLKAAVAKSLADIPENKRDGRLMASEVEMAIHMVKDSFPAAKRTLVRAVYLRRLKKLLQTQPDTVVGWCQELRAALFAFQNLRVLVTADVQQLEARAGVPMVAAWDVLTRGLDATPDMVPIVPPYTRANDEGRHPGGVGAVILPMTTLGDSSYSVSTTVGLRSFSDPRLPAVLVALGYLEAVEGPLWNAVRGNGLAYGTGFSREIDAGYLQFRVYRSPDASKAVAAAREAVDALATGRVPLDKHLVEGAVSGIVMALAEEQATMALAAQQNYVMGVVRGLDREWSHRVMRAARAVTGDQIRAAMQELVLPVFQPGTSNVVVTCAPLLEESIGKSFRAMGYKTQVRKLSDYYDDYGLPGEDDDEAEEEEEEEEDDDDDDNDDDDDDDEGSEEDEDEESDEEGDEDSGDDDEKGGRRK